MGGLGNQMFQYAAAKTLTAKLKTTLKLDLSFLDEDLNHQNITKREYALARFDIADPIIEKKELFHFFRICRMLGLTRIHGLNRTVFSNRIPLPKMVSHYAPSYYKKFHALSDNTYLDGYWQSEKYFLPAVDLIKNVFTNNDRGIIEKVKEIGRPFLGNTLCSIHIRRGDYISNPIARARHGACPVSYYLDAMAFITNKIHEVAFLVVTDDQDWVKNVFIPESGHYRVALVAGNDPFVDLAVMYSCDHHIIANSSFSWWGAWLGANPDKIVVTPRKWYADQTIFVDDMIPQSWIRM